MPTENVNEDENVNERNGAGRLPVARERAHAELAALARSTAGRALVLRALPGVDRTSLLGRAAVTAEREGHRVVRVTGVEAEARLPHAGLHQLLHPLLGEVARSDEATRAVLDGVFGRAEDDRPSVVRLGTAVLRLLSRAAVRQPLLLVVDDGQWLDDPSAEVLGFVGRRLAGSRVRLLIAVRAEVASRFDSAALPGWTVAVRSGTVPRGAVLADAHSAHRPDRTAVPVLTPLTWQERRVADLAAAGLTNKEIGRRMHLSPRTVASHLYRVFPKLGITTRAALRDALNRTAGAGRLQP
ncbi:AAA ATPase domain-containing protein [Streptomyces sp. TLI_053]|uniref:response regulator transcription factor n=1 Tax=Streptomyces sp. TLI_053 TaxID=1855352 RepID=UPI00087B22F3|nr:LuxR family transcriptional regulator [Streptomyces sp. TLI_053]SDS67215.1 AAA ATPase domain-containing protein [Streptomyces sp. TLI_053]